MSQMVAPFNNSEGSGPIRVMIVDDHEMVRRGLSDFLRIYKDFLLVGEASDGMEAVKLCRKSKPDVILMDLVMPHMNGVEATRLILCASPGVQIIALSSYDDERLVPAALEAGAISFLQKNVTMADLAEAIRKARTGISTLSPQATQFLISAATRHTEKQHCLTPREREVLAAMVAGMSNSEIAEQLVISLPTVKSHVSRILAKLEVKSRSEAIVFALKHDLTRGEPGLAGKIP
jgi:NarL family two-component system response regulator LiaR